MNWLIIQKNILLNLSNIKYIRRYNYKSTHISTFNQQCTSGMFSQDNRCQYCKGEKIISCISCYGSGKEYLGAMKETMCACCNGNGYNTCIYCGGSGVNHML